MNNDCHTHISHNNSNYNSMNNFLFCTDHDTYDMNFDLVIQISTKLFQQTIKGFEICGLNVTKVNNDIRLSFCSNESGIDVEHILDIPIFDPVESTNLCTILYISNKVTSFAETEPDHTILFKKGISRHIHIENNSDPTRDYFKLYISKHYPL